ncbi:MAG: aldo/keto reductase [Spirochaetes bacterium]|jgi:aryl-alcohol dehydrogenase-like predicted oxidoreductase|nr:aldo/keto reductase [Spirochaetota bacterium]
MLEKRELGKSGVKVYPIGIGLWAIGGGTWGTTNDNESLDTIDRALDLGIDFFDTADVYGDGHSEKLLGKAMQGRRDRFVLATKLGWRDFDGDNGKSSYTSSQKLIEGAESNLKRLNTDYIDFLQWHVNFRDPTMENFIDGCEKLKEQGKLRGYGVSTSDYSYLKEFNAYGNQDILQIDYSILNRTAEKDILPFCKEKRVGTIIRGGLAMGILTGKFSKDASFEESDFRNNWLKDPDQNKQFMKDLDAVDDIKEKFGDTDLARFAIRFILSNPDVSVVIPGAKRISQLESNFNAGEEGLLTKEEMDTINSIVKPGEGRKIWPA